MASQDPNPSSDPYWHQTPTLALKQNLCYYCWDESSNLKRCTACKRVAYCSVKCQKQDWNRNHKHICKKLVALNKQKKCVPSASRNWNVFYVETMLDARITDTMNPSELGLLVHHEPYCYHCYRRESQLEDGAKLNSCQCCHLTSFCTSCQQTHPSTECATLQDVVADGKILVDLHRRTGKESIINLSKYPRIQHCPLSSATDWYDYYTRLSDKGAFSSKMDRHLRYQGDGDAKDREFVEGLRYGTNTTTIQLTLIAALEATVPHLGTRSSINLHIIGAAEREYTAALAFEELLHLLPSLATLQLSFIGFNVETQAPYKVPCCTTCTNSGRSISITFWEGPYHTYVGSESYKTPDLAAAFRSGFSVIQKDDWRPTIKYLARAPHPTLFTAARYFEIQGEMDVWKSLGAKFVKKPEVNKWKGMSPSLVVCGDKPNEICYHNHWWYIVEQR